MRRIGRSLAVIGHAGLDVYLTPRGAPQMSPAGSAFNILCGVCAAGAGPVTTAVVNVSRSFNAEYYLNVFRQFDVSIVPNKAINTGENLFVFPLDIDGNPTRDDQISVAKFRPSIEALSNKLNFKDLHIHLAVMPPEEQLQAKRRLSLIFPDASVSLSLYAPYACGWTDEYLTLLAEIDIVFMNHIELQQLRRVCDIVQLAADRIVVVTCGSAGAIVYVNGIPFCSAPAPEVIQLCSVGAGDVFCGAFLGSMLRTRSVHASVVAGCSWAAASVREYGVRHILVSDPDESTNPNVPPFSLCPSAISNFDPSETIPSKWIDATAVFVIKDGRLLLIRKNRGFQLQEDLLFVPGGKNQRGETPLNCARRELVEETGLTAREFLPLESCIYYDATTGSVLNFATFLANEVTGEARPGDDAAAIYWKTFDELNLAKLFPLTRAHLTLLKSLHPYTLRTCQRGVKPSQGWANQNQPF